MNSRVHPEQWLWGAAAFVLAWRATALFFPHEAMTDPQAVRLAMAALGLWFLASGLWAFRRAPGQASLLFAWFGITGGLHWGGPIGLGPERAQNLLLAFYVVLSTSLHESLLLHLALAFPRPVGVSRRGWALVLVYLPTLAGCLLFIALLIRTASSSLLGTFGILFPAATLWSLLAGGLWITRLVTADPAERRARHLGLVVAAMILGWTPTALLAIGVSVRPDYDGLANLATGLLPAALALALAAGGRRQQPRGKLQRS